MARALGKAFRESGTRVHLVDIDAEVRSTAKAIGGMGHVRDLSDRAAVSALVQGIVAQEDRLDILARATGGVCGQADVSLET